MSTIRKWSVLALALALAAAVIAAGCGGDDEEDGGAGGGGGGGGGGTLTVGSDIPYPPFEQGKAPDYTGFDIELVREIGNRINRDVQFEDTSFDTIFRDLAQGKFDMVASATTITPERERQVDFSNPYYLSEQALLVKEGSDVQTVQDLTDATVGVQQGTTGQAYAEDETDAGQVRPFPEGPDAVNALRADQVDAVIIDLPVAQQAIEDEQGMVIATSIPTDEQYGFALPQDETELREQVNEALQEMKDDGTYAEIYRKWFDQDPPEEVLDATHEPQ